MKLYWSAMSANVGDKIFDKKRNKIGKVVRIGQSGNYTILFVDFNGKVKRIDPMDDAQIYQNYYKVLED